MSAIERPWANMSPSGQPSAAQPGEQFERAAAVGLGAAAGLGHEVVAAVLGRCPKDIRRPETVRAVRAYPRPRDRKTRTPGGLPCEISLSAWSTKFWRSSGPRAAPWACRRCRRDRRALLRR